MALSVDMLYPDREHAYELPGRQQQQRRLRANSIFEKADKANAAVHIKRLIKWGSLFCVLLLVLRLYTGRNPAAHTFDTLAHGSASNQTFYTTSSGHIDQLQLQVHDFVLPSDIDYSSIDSVPISKPYFEQDSGNQHRAAGYGNETDLTDSPYVRASLLRHLLHALDAFAEETEFVFWLAHGSLLGQYWAEKIMAHDTDVDVQTSVGALHRIRHQQGKLFRDRFELHINPYYIIRKSANSYRPKTEHNVIDARWIDTLSGHFIDITALATSESAIPKHRGSTSLSAERTKNNAEYLTASLLQSFAPSPLPPTLQDKSVHIYEYASLSPLIRCHFEDIPLWCPADTEAVLVQEYPDYKSTHHLSWRWNAEKKTFMRMTCARLLQMYTEPSLSDCDWECREVVQHERELRWTYLVVPDEHQNQCQLSVSWIEGSETVSRNYRGVHEGEDPWNKMTTSLYGPVDWSARGPGSK